MRRIFHHTLSAHVRLAGLASVVLAASVPAMAQGVAHVNGVVTDSTGAAIPNAQVTATDAATGQKTQVTSAGNGDYSFPSLAPAHYTVTVTAAGFTSFSNTNIVLLADQTVTVNAALKIGNTSEIVQVTDAPPQIDTSTGTLSQVIEVQRVNDLPLNGRNAATLTVLIPGVVTAPSTNIDQGQTKTFPVVAAVTINGTRANQVNYMLDGGNNVDEYTNVNAPFPMPDSLQEFSVETSNYNAQYGQNAGGVVNIITRSGSNHLHGDAFEYVRNRVFNAANYFTYVNGVKTVDPLKRNQFGGTIGGPIVIPHLYNGRDKSFFFFGMQATRYRTAGTGGTAILPTPAQLAGTFTGLASPILNPTTLLPYPCTPTGATFTCQVNPADYNKSSLSVLTYLPKITGTDGTYQFYRPVKQNFIEYTARGDQQLSSKDRLTLRYFYDRFDNTGVLDTTDLLSYSDGATIRYHNALIGETHTFSNNLLNNFELSYQIEDASRGPLPGAPNVNTFGVTDYQPAFSQINQIQVGGGSYFTIGDNPQASFRRNNYTLADDLSYVLRSHTIGIGFHGELAKVDVNNLYQQPGVFQFNSNNSITNPLADFLLGGLTNFQQASGQFFNNRYKVTGYYVQDVWKVNRRLTLNYGVRYEPFYPQHEALNREGMFSNAARVAGQISSTHPQALAGLLFPGDTGFVNNMVNPVYSHFMPRFGFALDVFGDGKTSLRGGGGQFYDTRLPGVFDNIFANSVPYVASVNVAFGATALANFSNPYASIPGGDPFPAPQPPPINFFTTANYQNSSYSTFDPTTFRVPRTYDFNLAVEQQFTGSLSSRIAYVGSTSNHQYVPTDINPVDNRGFLGGVTNQNYTRRLFYSANNVQNYTQQIATVDTGGNAFYHSMQASLKERMGQTLTAFVNYTWSKAIDNFPFGATATAVVPGSGYVLPVYEPNYKRLDRGPSDYDHRNVISVSYVWMLPKLKEGPGGLKYAANGWQMDGIYSFRSGDPLTITGAGNSGTLLNRERAVWNGMTPYGTTTCAGVSTACKPFLNKANFSTNPSYTVNQPLSYGNVVKGSFTGPQYNDWDVSLIRNFPIHEATQLQFRAEFFNVLNHTNQGDPSQSITSSAFGRITSASDPRIGQLALKVLF
jgi:outer membrane receptor protein involved in Fe transport